MKFVLTCDCGSTDFVYKEDSFRCKDCGEELHEEEAGKHLLGDFEY